MGAGASTGNATKISQSQLDNAVEQLISLKWDRVHLRVHYAQITSENTPTIHGRVNFEVIPGTEIESPVEHTLLSDHDSPNRCSFLAERSSGSEHPIFNSSSLLLYLRSGDAKEPTSTDKPTRKLRVKLEDVKSVVTRLEEKLIAAAKVVSKTVQSLMKEKPAEHPYAVKTNTPSPSPTKQKDVDNATTDDKDEVQEVDNQIKNDNFDDVATVEPDETEVVTEDVDEDESVKDAVVIDTIEIELPAPEEGWVYVPIKGQKSIIYVSIKTSLAEDVIQSKASIDQFTSQMTKNVLQLKPTKSKNEKPNQKALVRSMKVEGNKRALVWISGFNDTFHHPLLGEALVTAGYDLWVIDFRRCGACRKEFPNETNPLEYHHVNDVSEYFEEINKTLELMKEQHYEKVVGYGSSLGGIILSYYSLISLTRDKAFDGFILNSPFIDWSFSNNLLTEMTMETFVSMKMVSRKKPIQIGGSLTHLNPSQFRYHSLCEYDTNTKALYNLNITIGWSKTIRIAHQAILHTPFDDPVTKKPYLLLSSKHDKIVNDYDLIKFSERMGPSRTFIQLQYAEHDIFASFEKDKVDEAISYVLSWLKTNI